MKLNIVDLHYLPLNNFPLPAVSQGTADSQNTSESIFSPPVEEIRRLDVFLFVDAKNKGKKKLANLLRLAYRKRRTV